jgi:hypothetical protein
MVETQNFWVSTIDEMRKPEQASKQAKAKIQKQKRNGSVLKKMGQN